jgi:hypothetical protein
MNSDRRNFIRNVTKGAAGIAVGGSVIGMSAKSYSRIIGANERLNIAIAGLGRRLELFMSQLQKKRLT